MLTGVRTCRLAVIALCAASIALADSDQVSPSRPGEDNDPEFRIDVLPLLDRYCVTCHGGDRPKGGFSLEPFRGAADAAVRVRPGVWQRVAERLEAGKMPPEIQKQPTADETRRMLRWIASGATSRPDNVAHARPRVTIRRLNRAEYNNTIRDLLGVDFQPADDFPSDDIGYGFDNIGDVLSIPPVLMEKYLAAAERIAEAAIVVDRAVASRTTKIEGEKFTGLRGSYPYGDQGMALTQYGELTTEFTFPAAGTYTIRVRAFGQQAGREPVRMAIAVDAREVRRVDVKAVEASPGTYVVKTDVAAGPRKISVAFLNDHVEPDDPSPENRDRNLFVEHVEVIGPQRAKAKPLQDGHRQIIPRQPTGIDREQLAREILGTLATRAYRRPATPDDINRLIRFIDLAVEHGDSFERGIQLAVQAILVSPHFLFRVELDSGSGGVGPVTPISEYELASRLSYFLWSSMPDDELFVQARAGTLRQNLDGQVRRMLGDSKSRALVENFGLQWLQLRNLATATPDAKRFPAFDEMLRADMLRETTLFLEHVMRADRSVLELLDANYTFVNDRLAEHYGIAGVTGDKFRRVSLAGTPRSGLLTQASVLTVTSNPTRTSPVKRGRWVLEQLLGAPPAPPPPNVPELDEPRDGDSAGTLRERMQQHRADPNCATCHARMDPLGFGLENFDAIGAWRDRDAGRPIDASGELPNGQKFDGPVELKAVLKSRQDLFCRCLAQKMFTYAVGRGTERSDEPAIDAIVAHMAENEFSFSSLVLGIVRSESFQSRPVNSVATDD